MMYFTVRCDILPGKEEEMDRFLADKATKFWLSQPGVKSFHVYRDTLVGWPERTIMIEIEDLGSLQGVVNNWEHKQLRREFLTYATDVESQIQDTVI